VQEGLISLIARMIKDVFPVSFITLVIVSVFYWYVFLVWRPYIKGQLEINKALLEKLLDGEEDA